MPNSRKDQYIFCFSTLENTVSDIMLDFITLNFMLVINFHKHLHIYNFPMIFTISLIFPIYQARIQAVVYAACWLYTTSL